ncbi:MAG: exopolysaccharide Pel transporter PelG [Candidatus Riflebacteria bacterium]|nr:exopolysaccharide Pel transporter PelG [Candidatus Riflebacteria bacterium]
MAGIGFKLRKLLDEGTYFAEIKVFFFAAYLIAGPWLITVSVIGLISLFSSLSGNDYDIFRTAVVYIYAFSLILTGLYQMPLTRYLADQLYIEKVEEIAPSFLGMFIVVSVVSAAVGWCYALIFPLSVFFRIIFSAGLTIVSLLWLAGIYLSCLRDFNKIGFHYTFGGILSLILTLILEKYFGSTGALLGFLTGQAITLLGLSFRILHELSFPGLRVSYECLKSLKKYRIHLLAGFFFNCAIWIDKFLFWLSSYSSSPCRGMYSFGHYDTSIFLAYITIIPALAIYLTNIETSFYETYREFYGSILKQQPLKTIMRRYSDILRNIRFTFFELVKTQGLLTLVIYYFTPEILMKMQYPATLAVTVRWGLWAAFFQTLFLFSMMLLLYFELARETLWSTICFFGINAAVTALVIVCRLDDYYALGYFLSAIISFTFSSWLLYKRLQELVFSTFMSQPIPHEGTPTENYIGTDGRIGKIIFPN